MQAEKRSSVPVVVPTVSWLGSDQVDDPAVRRPAEPHLVDGRPGALAARVRRPGRPSAPQFSDDVALLLVFLDRARIRYDLTSDLDLDLSRNPRASDRSGVLLAGPETWVTRSLARRLRRYVLDGGRAAAASAPDSVACAAGVRWAPIACGGDPADHGRSLDGARLEPVSRARTARGWAGRARLTARPR